jgi:nucleotide-binding universal stress UspA family protein
MKRLLVPTDFSTVAGYASDAAVAIAEALGGAVHFHHQLEDDSYFREWTSQSYQSARSFAEASFNELKASYKSHFLPLTSSYSYANLADEMASLVRQRHIDAVVMGIEGRHGFRGWLGADNVARVVRQVDCPVLLVRYALQKEKFTNVIFVSDFQEDTVPAYKQMLELLSPFNPCIHLLSIDPKGAEQANQDKMMERFQAKTTQMACSVQEAIAPKNFNRNIATFAEKTQADLVVMAHTVRRPLLDRFSGTLPEMLVEELKLPLMALRSRTVVG